MISGPAYYARRIDSGRRMKTNEKESVDVATVKGRIRELLDELPENQAAEVERLLLSLKGRPYEAPWSSTASATFASWFSDAEYQYPDGAGIPS